MRETWAKARSYALAGSSLNDNSLIARESLAERHCAHQRPGLDEHRGRRGARCSQPADQPAARGLTSLFPLSDGSETAHRRLHVLRLPERLA